MRASPGPGAGRWTSSQRMTSGVPLAWMRIAWGMGLIFLAEQEGIRLPYCVTSHESCGPYGFDIAGNALNSIPQTKQGRRHEQAQGATEIRQGLRQRMARHSRGLFGGGHGAMRL